MRPPASTACAHEVPSPEAQSWPDAATCPYLVSVLDGREGQGKDPPQESVEGDVAQATANRLGVQSTKEKTSQERGGRQEGLWRLEMQGTASSFKGSPLPPPPSLSTCLPTSAPDSCTGQLGHLGPSVGHRGPGP